MKSFFRAKKSSLKKYQPVQIWFLDDDLQKSAEYQTNYTLDKSIDGCVKALVTARMYFVGVRSKKFYDYFFGRDRLAETMSGFFPGWPFKKKPAFTTYTAQTSKWCRKCLEHYKYVESYLGILLTEYEYRFGRRHKSANFYDWQTATAPVLNIPRANLKNVCIPWKSLNLKWRRKNLVEGFRLQFMNSFVKDPFGEYDGSMRDMPDFVIRYFKLDIGGIS